MTIDNVIMITHDNVWLNIVTSNDFRFTDMVACRPYAILCRLCLPHVNMIQRAYRILQYRRKHRQERGPTGAGPRLFKQLLACSTLWEELLKRGTKGRITWLVLSAMQLQQFNPAQEIKHQPRSDHQPSFQSFRCIFERKLRVDGAAKMLKLPQKIQ